MGILGAQLHLFSAGRRLCCAFEVRGGTSPLYPMTGWEGAGAADLPWEEAGCELQGPALLGRCEAASRSLSSSKWL